MPHVKIPASPRVARKREARVRRILDAAMEIAAEEGVDGLTVQRLAAHLDYAVGALYRYFPSKEALLVELQRRVIAELGDAAEAVVGALVADPEDADGGADPAAAALTPILAVAELYRAFAAGSPLRFNLVSRVVADPRALLSDDGADRVIATMAPTLARVEALFAAAADAGALAPGGAGTARERTLVFWSSLQGVLQLRKLERLQATEVGPIDTASLSASLLGALLAGWGAPPAALAAAASLVAARRDRLALDSLVREADPALEAAS